MHTERVVVCLRNFFFRKGKTFNRPSLSYICILPFSRVKTICWLTCIVYQDVDLVLRVQESLGARPHRLERGQVELVDGDVGGLELVLDVLGGHPGLLDAPAQHDDPGTSFSQVKGGLLPDPGVRS